MRNTATINGASLVYDDIGPGDGPALLLVHGYPLNRAMWRAQRDALVGLGWRGILPDLRGFGDSQATPPPYSMDLFADDLAALLDHLGLERVALGGLSMGGYIAFAFWRRHAARVRALVLADTQAALDTAEARAGRLKATDEVRGGRFVALHSGEQFALPEAVGLLRELRRRPPPPAVVVVSAVDPLALAGIVTPGERVASVAQNKVVWRGGVAVAAIESGAPRWLGDFDPATRDAVITALRRPHAAVAGA